MNYILPLIFSGIIINLVHGYLLVAYKNQKKFSISEHAVLDRKARSIYIIGHIVCGALCLMFAKIYYVNTIEVPSLFYLSIFTVIFEYLQAILPAKGKTNRLHIIAALIMWASFISLGLLTIIFAPAALIQKLIAMTFYAAILFELRNSYKNLNRLYKYQMTMVVLFYLAMIVVVI